MSGRAKRPAFPAERTAGKAVANRNQSLSAVQRAAMKGLRRGQSIRGVAGVGRVNKGAGLRAVPGASTGVYKGLMGLQTRHYAPAGKGRRCPQGVVSCYIGRTSDA